MLTKAAIITLIVSYSNLLGFNPDVAVAVAKVESGLNPNAIGLKGEVGLFQLMPQYVSGVTKVGLSNPETNIIIGILRLKEEQKRCGHKKELSYLICYNAGRNNAKMVKRPDIFPYVLKVKKEIKEGVLYGKSQVYANGKRIAF